MNSVPEGVGPGSGNGEGGDEASAGAEEVEGSDDGRMRRGGGEEE